MKKNHLNAVLGTLFLLLFISSCTDLDDNEPADLTKNTIKKGSELFNLLASVAEKGDNPVENSICVDFVYPFKLFLYNENLVPQGEIILTSDQQFSDVLEQLPANVSISISYPLQTQLPDGSFFSVNNNEQLKTALESCSNEDIINYCSGLFSSADTPFAWKVGYVEGQNNDFGGAVFTTFAGGTVELFHLGITYQGAWSFVYLNNELHLNIFLAGNSEVAQGWNYNFKVTHFFDDTIQLQTSLTGNRTLIKYQSSSLQYNIGDIGPSGGIIAYDKGTFSNGWQYIEVAPNDSIIEEWGCMNSAITNAQYTSIGSGYQNSVAIANFHVDLGNYFSNPSICSGQNNGSVAAKTALTQVINDKKDWCIPSVEELHLLYQNVHLMNNGNFDSTNYWSSSEHSSSRAKCVNFGNGQLITLYKNTALVKTRLIRYF